MKRKKNEKTKILFICATHGNEAFSIPVLKELEKDFPHSKYNYDWIIGNFRALEENKRFIDTDINRVAPGEENSPIWEEKRAAQIIELSKEYDIVIDIHGTKSDFGIVKIIPYPSYQNLSLAGYFNEKRNVIWYSKKKKGPLVQFMHCPALELECGDKTKTKTQELLKAELETFLENVYKNNIFPNLNEQIFFSIFDKVTKDATKRKDFKKVRFEDETFYPFLTSNGYKNTAYYRMKKIKLEEFLHD